MRGGQKLVPMGQLGRRAGHRAGHRDDRWSRRWPNRGSSTYEPYNGVRLTSAGEKLAARVLRRHRLIELFLVQVMGMNWDEVHEDAEQMEHVVSDRLIERIDEMLGRPDVRSARRSDSERRRRSSRIERSRRCSPARSTRR